CRFPFPTTVRPSVSPLDPPGRTDALIHGTRIQREKSLFLPRVIARLRPPSSSPPLGAIVRDRTATIVRDRTATIARDRTATIARDRSDARRVPYASGLIPGPSLLTK